MHGIHQLHLTRRPHLTVVMRGGRSVPVDRVVGRRAKTLLTVSALISRRAFERIALAEHHTLHPVLPRSPQPAPVHGSR